jgi:hypothetical protein
MFNEEQSDILIVGASRASHHYDCQVFIDSLGMTCNNVGVDGMPVYDAYLNVIRALENGKVKIVLFDLSAAQLGDEWIDNRLNYLQPYYWQNDSVKTIVNELSQYGHATPYLFCSSFLQYYSQGSIIFDFIAPRYLTSKHGYSPLQSAKTKFSINRTPDDSFQCSERAKRYLERLCTLCKENQVKLYLITSPMLSRQSSLCEFLTQFSKDNDVDFLDYSNLGECVDNVSLWYDAGHLSQEGAEAFSKVLVSYLKR